MEGNRMNPLTTVKWPLIIGFVLAVVIAALVEGGLTFNTITLAALTRWLHIIFGIFWIGLLYYFNAVQTPGMAAAAADKGGPGGAGVNKYIAPRALAVVSLVSTRHLAAGRLFAVADALAASSVRLPWACRMPVFPPESHHRHRRVARHHHAVQCVGTDLAQPKKDLGDRAGHR